MVQTLLMLTIGRQRKSAQKRYIDNDLGKWKFIFRLVTLRLWVRSMKILHLPLYHCTHSKTAFASRPSPLSSLKVNILLLFLFSYVSSYTLYTADSVCHLVGGQSFNSNLFNTFLRGTMDCHGRHCGCRTKKHHEVLMILENKCPKVLLPLNYDDVIHWYGHL